MVRHSSGPALRTGEGMTKRHLAAAVAVLFATASTPASAEKWATCKFAHQPHAGDPEQRCIEISLSTWAKARPERVQSWCIELPGVNNRIEAGRTCPKGPRCVRDTANAAPYSDRSCRPVTRQDWGGRTETQCTYTIPSEGIVLALQYVDYGGNGLAAFCKSQGGQFKRN